MQGRQMEIDSFSQTKIEGKIHAENDTDIFMLSIPYSDGWKVEIDDEPVETFAVLDGLLAANITSGQHRIKLTYRTPYLYVGIATSVLSAFLLYIIDKKKRLDQ